MFRLTKNNELSLVNKDLEKPNGIALSTDHSTLYVSNSEVDKAQIIAIELDSQGNAEKLTFIFRWCEIDSGRTRFYRWHDSTSRLIILFVSIPNGLGILSPKGELLGKVALGQVTNMTFNNTHSYLYITSPKRLLRLKIKSMQ